uniref:Uncharacterized protein n=1 Tax=Nelumbo nucifera TaxID=4432 RepID=A0A822YYX0_NELNU|nr:TPA_asm: hypothetical protein HUJ06_008351 [Nelumbo nucifera]
MLAYCTVEDKWLGMNGGPKITLFQCIQIEFATDWLLVMSSLIE